MRVLPVMDLTGGEVVHARAGRRVAYQPLQSIWTEYAADPLKLAAAYQKRFGIAEWYVADLDALEGREPQKDVIHRLIAQGLHLWLDAGIRNVSQASACVKTGVQRVIVA